MTSRKAHQRPAPSGGAVPTFRSGAVARMAHMPVATLRIWEQRYGAVQPRTAASGHRLYSPADVQRVLLLRQLTAQGHAIGSIAALDATQLQRVAQQATQATDTATACGAQAGTAPRNATRSQRAVRLAVVGAALATRLHRPAVAQRRMRIAQRVAVFDTLDEAVRAGASARADLLLWHAPQLQPDGLADLQAARQACGAEQVAVVYRFAGSAATRALAAAGVAVLREPADDAALGTWLAAIEAGLLHRAPADRVACASSAPPSAAAQSHVPPRRYDDATLTTIAGLSPTLACECPRHVAELLMQLSSFEDYSAACIHRGAADARLHAYLQQVAAASRALFEAALEHVAQHEGLALA